MKKILLFGVIMLILTGCSNKEIKEEKQITENNGMLSYTIDGEKTDIKPTKEEGYIVNKIICDNGSDMMWDNDNWEVELTKINSKDRCKVDFTKDTSTSGYRITVTSNMPSALDSLSKSTTLNGTVKIYSKAIIKNVTGCTGVIEDNKVVISNITQNQTCNIEVEDKTLATVIKSVYTPLPGRTNFSVIDDGTPSSTPEGLTGGLYTGVDNQGTTYYFSGDGSSMNNWVSFAEKLWRIIRINGNGSVRLLYAGSGSTDGYIGSAQYYATSDGQHNHPAYVGWKYTKVGSLSGDRGNSTKSYVYCTVESWYNSNISSSYGNYIDTEAIYFNDRSIGSGAYSTSSSFNYAPYTRLINKAPTLQCSDTSDRFTTFGLMTADEVAYAGGVYGSNNNGVYYYLNKDGGSSTGDKWWWTMSPSNWNSPYSSASVFFVSGSTSPGFLSGNGVHGSVVVRPVISLKPEVKVIGGDGRADSPYEVILP